MFIRSNVEQNLGIWFNEFAKFGVRENVLREAFKLMPKDADIQLLYDSCKKIEKFLKKENNVFKYFESHDLVMLSQNWAWMKAQLDLIDKNGAGNGVDHDGNQLGFIRLAALNGDVSAVKHLNKRVVAKVNTLKPNAALEYLTLGDCCVFGGTLDILTDFLDSKENQELNQHGQTPAMTAAMFGSLSCMEVCIDDDPEFDFERVDAIGRTIAMLAADYGQLECLKLIFERAPMLLYRTFDQQISNPKTYAHLILEGKNPSVIFVFLDLYPQFKTQGLLESDRYAVQLARAGRKDELLALLAKKQSILERHYPDNEQRHFTLEYYAAGAVNTDCLIALLAMTNAKSVEKSLMINQDHTTIAHFAAMERSRNCLVYLLSRYPRLLTRKDLDGQTPLECAKSHGLDTHDIYQELKSIWIERITNFDANWAECLVALGQAPKSPHEVQSEYQSRVAFILKRLQQQIISSPGNVDAKEALKYLVEAGVEGAALVSRKIDGMLKMQAIKSDLNANTSFDEESNIGKAIKSLLDEAVELEAEDVDYYYGIYWVQVNPNKYLARSAAINAEKAAFCMYRGARKNSNRALNVIKEQSLHPIGASLVRLLYAVLTDNMRQLENLGRAENEMFVKHVPSVLLDKTLPFAKRLKIIHTWAQAERSRFVLFYDGITDDKFVNQLSLLAYEYLNDAKSMTDAMLFMRDLPAMIGHEGCAGVILQLADKKLKSDIRAAILLQGCQFEMRSEIKNTLTERFEFEGHEVKKAAKAALNTLPGASVSSSITAITDLAKQEMQKLQGLKLSAQRFADLKQWLLDFPKNDCSTAKAILTNSEMHAALVNADSNILVYLTLPENMQVNSIHTAEQKEAALKILRECIDKCSYESSDKVSDDCLDNSRPASVSALGSFRRP